MCFLYCVNPVSTGCRSLFSFGEFGLRDMVMVIFAIRDSVVIIVRVSVGL